MENNEIKHDKLSEEEKHSIEEKMQKEMRIQVYKWLKIVQAIILIALGIIFVAISQATDESSPKALALSLGIVMTIYGVMEVVAGYLLNRSLLAQDILIGILFISMSLVMFLRSDYVKDIIMIVLIGVMLGYAAMLIVYGVDRIVAKGVKKNIVVAVFAFLGAAVLLGGGIAYIVFWNKNQGKVLKYVMMIFGAVLVLLGAFDLIVFLVKLKNTREVEKEKEIKEKAKAEAMEADEGHEVKVIDINDLKKENRKKRKTVVIDLSNQDEEDDNAPKQLANDSDK
jgi:hypothetical protein